MHAAQIYKSVSLTWLVTHDGNAPINGFFVTHRYTNRTITRDTVYRLTTEQGNVLQIDNLAVGVKHLFIVEAENRLGRSDPAKVEMTLISTGKYIILS